MGEKKLDIWSSLVVYMEMTGCLALAMEPEGLGHLHGLARFAFRSAVLWSFWRAEGGYYAVISGICVFY